MKTKLKIAPISHFFPRHMLFYTKCGCGKKCSNHAVKMIGNGHTSPVLGWAANKEDFALTEFVPTELS